MRVKKLFTALILGLGLALALVWLLGGDRLPVARAASLTVDVTNDENDGTCTPGDCSLREAIVAANGNGVADTITLVAGTYTLTITGTDEDLCALGDLDVTDTLTIEGAGPGQTIIDASGVISDRVFDVQVGAGTVVISGVTIINGNVTGNGGGIRSRAADLTLINTAVISNAANGAGGHGGGVYVYQGSATLNGGQILSNTAGGMGGGVYLQQSSTALSGTQVISNAAQDGGGVYVYRGGATLNGGQILSNTASDDGGGVHTFGSDTFGGGIFTQTGDSIIAHNTAGDRGGGVCVTEYSTTTLSGGQILSNTASNYGGGVYVWQGSVTLSGAQVLRNAAGYGGGVYAYDGSTMLNGAQVLSNSASQRGGGMHILHGCTMLNGAQVVSNTASGDGGGLYISGGTASLFLVNTTVSRNAADDHGGGLYADDGATTITYTTVASNTGEGIYRAGGAITVQNSIVAYNGADNCGGTLASNGHNLDSGATCGFAASGDITDTDPLLGPLVEDGGTLVHPLLDGSPAIDAGVCVAGIATDQRSVSRPQGSVCDIGAYEWAWQAVYLPLVLSNYQ